MTRLKLLKRRVIPFVNERNNGPYKFNLISLQINYKVSTNEHFKNRQDFAILNLRLLTKTKNPYLPSLI
jgi:hypothetical protein